MDRNKFVLGQKVRFTVREDGNLTVIKGIVVGILPAPKGFVYDIDEVEGDGEHNGVAERDIIDDDCTAIDISYTIIAIFAVADYADADQCWVAQYSRREDAIEAFAFKMNEAGVMKDGLVTWADGKTASAADTFDTIAATGECFDTDIGNGKTRWFVRKERVQRHFDKDEIVWD